MGSPSSTDDTAVPSCKSHHPPCREPHRPRPARGKPGPVKFSLLVKAGAATHAPRQPMKPIVTFSILLMLLSSCAPRAIVLGRPTSSKPRASTSSSSNRGYVDNAHSTPMPRPAGDNLGLLDPKGLSSLPEEQDMRPTGGNRDSGPVIANPPSGDSSSE